MMFKKYDELLLSVDDYCELLLCLMSSRQHYKDCLESSPPDSLFLSSYRHSFNAIEHLIFVFKESGEVMES